jgi:hypothetical protein
LIHLLGLIVHLAVMPHLSKNSGTSVVAFRFVSLACQEEFFVNNPLDVSENYEYALDFTLHVSCLFLSQ